MVDHQSNPSLACRLFQICSEKKDRDLRFQELHDLLLESNYPVRIINTAIRKAQSVTREMALKHVARPVKNTRPRYAINI